MEGPVHQVDEYASWAERGPGHNPELPTVLQVDVALPVVLQQTPDAADPLDFFQGPHSPHAVDYEEQGGGSPVLRSAVLDPFAAPVSHAEAPQTVFWGRQSAIGGYGTPMVGPRVLGGPTGLGAGKTVDDLGVQRQMEMPSSGERRYSRSPDISLRAVGVGGGDSSNWRERGEEVTTGAKNFFGTPSVAAREQSVQGASGIQLRSDFQDLRTYAMKLRAGCTDFQKHGLATGVPSLTTAENGQPTIADPSLQQHPPCNRKKERRDESSGSSSRVTAEECSRGWVAWEDRAAEVGRVVPESVRKPHLARQGGKGGYDSPMVVLDFVERGMQSQQLAMQGHSGTGGDRGTMSVSTTFMRGQPPTCNTGTESGALDHTDLVHESRTRSEDMGLHCTSDNSSSWGEGWDYPRAGPTHNSKEHKAGPEWGGLGVTQSEGSKVERQVLLGGRKGWKPKQQ